MIDLSLLTVLVRKSEKFSIIISVYCQRNFHKQEPTAKSVCVYALVKASKLAFKGLLLHRAPATKEDVSKVISE